MLHAHNAVTVGCAHGPGGPRSDSGSAFNGVDLAQGGGLLPDTGVCVREDFLHGRGIRLEVLHDNYLQLGMACRGGAQRSPGESDDGGNGGV